MGITTQVTGRTSQVEGIASIGSSFPRPTRARARGAWQTKASPDPGSFNYRRMPLCGTHHSNGFGSFLNLTRAPYNIIAINIEVAVL